MDLRTIAVVTKLMTNHTCTVHVHPEHSSKTMCSPIGPHITISNELRIHTYASIHKISLHLTSCSIILTTPNQSNETISYFYTNATI